MVLTDVEQKSFTAQGVTSRRLPRLTLESFLSAEQMTIQKFPPAIQSPSDLYHIFGYCGRPDKIPINTSYYSGKR